MNKINLKPLDFRPTCKYGHGDLVLETPSGDMTEGYYLGGYKIYKSETGSTSLRTETVYTLTMYRCAVCGYLELFDGPE